MQFGQIIFIRATKPFDCWPLDDLFSSHPEIFCTERLKYKIETSYLKFTGIFFQEVRRISIGANWKDNHPQARPGFYWYVHITGKLMIDDFGT